MMSPALSGELFQDGEHNAFGRFAHTGLGFAAVQVQDDGSSCVGHRGWIYGVAPMTWLIHGMAPLIAKIFIVVIFPFSALDKIINWRSALEQANSSFLPGGPVLLVLAMIVEIVTPICIVFNWHPGWAAFVLAGYCVITAVLYHNFWSYPRFWLAGSEGHPHVWDFFKNFAIVGGCIFIMLGSAMVTEVENAVVPSAAQPHQDSAPR